VGIQIESNQSFLVAGSRPRCCGYATVIVTMVSVDMMQMIANQIVHMIAVRNRLM
jgi:hypothetical protein